MAIQTPWERDLRSAQPVKQLYDHVKDAIATGYDRNRAIEELGELFDLVQERGTEAEQDAVTDVLDALTHQCGPGLEI